MSDRNANDRGPGPDDPNEASRSGPSPGPAGNGVRRPLGVVVGSTVDGFRTLLRKHVELAKIEVTEIASVRAKGAGLMAAAAVLVLFALGYAAAAAAAALALVMPTWAADLILAVALVLVALVLVSVGRRTMRTAPTAPERTREAVKEDARWAKQQIAR